MKKRAVILTLLFGIASFCVSVRAQNAPAAADRPVKDKWALVVGISKFARPEMNLKYPAKDAQDFYNFLIKEGNFQPDHVKLLVDEQATKNRVLSELGSRWLPHVANPDDLVLIYISSHGSASEMDVGGVNYIIAHDSDINDLFTTGIEMQELARTIKRRVHSDRVVVMLDACHSGAASPDSKGLSRTGNIDAEELMQGSGQMVISSSLPQQVSWELKNGQNGAFTKYLIEGLRVNGQKTKLSEAFDFMKDKVQETVLRERGVLQTPVLKQLWEGKQLLLCAKPTAPRPGLDDSAENQSESHSVGSSTTHVGNATLSSSSSSNSSSSLPSGQPRVTGNDKAAADALIAATLANLKPAGTTTLLNNTPSTSANATTSSSVTQSNSQPKFKVAVFKAYGPTKYTLDSPANVGQWGGIKDKSEFDNVPSLVSNFIAQELEDSLKSKKGKSVILLENEAPGARSISGDGRWQADAKFADASYVLVLSVDNCQWQSGTLAHTYALTISAWLYSASGANVYKTGYTVVKKPNFADMKGGRYYFETVVVPEIAEKVTKLIVKSIPVN